MIQDIARVLITQEQLKTRIAEMGKELAEEYSDKEPIFIGAGTTTSGQVKMLKDVSTDIRGRHVVILEDILDTGLTLEFVRKHLLEKEPASLRICTLLDKPERRKVDITADYVGFTIPNEFVVGYGLDYQEFYRNLPFVGILKPEVYSK